MCGRGCVLGLICRSCPPTGEILLLLQQSGIMTTLLDLKSSVLRQVQRSQSLRGRREPPPPTPGSPLRPRPEPLPRRWVPAASSRSSSSEVTLRRHGLFPQQRSVSASLLRGHSLSPEETWTSPAHAQPGARSPLKRGFLRCYLRSGHVAWQPGWGSLGLCFPQPARPSR